jgi:hypothetical protein
MTLSLSGDRARDLLLTDEKFVLVYLRPKIYAELSAMSTMKTVFKDKRGEVGAESPCRATGRKTPFKATHGSKGNTLIPRMGH